MPKGPAAPGMPGFGEAEQMLFFDPGLVADVAPEVGLDRPPSERVELVGVAGLPPSVAGPARLDDGKVTRFPLWMQKVALEDELTRLLPDVGSRDNDTGDNYRRTKEYLRRVNAQIHLGTRQGELPIPVVSQGPDAASEARAIQAALALDPGRPQDAELIGAPMGSMYVRPPDEPRLARVEGRRQASPVTGFSAVDPVDFIRWRSGDKEFQARSGVFVVPADAIHKAVNEGSILSHLDPGDPLYVQSDFYNNRGTFGPRWDVMRIQGKDAPSRQQQYLVRLSPDGDAAVVPYDALTRLLSSRNRTLRALEPNSRPPAAPTPDPAVVVGEVSLATPEDLQKYDREGGKWRSMMRNLDRGSPATTAEDVWDPYGSQFAAEGKGGFYKPYGGAINLATRDSAGRWSIGGRRADGVFVAGGKLIDPAASVTVRTGDLDSTASWDRAKEISLSQFVAELNQKYKTPVVPIDKLKSNSAFTPVSSVEAFNSGVLGFLKVVRRVDDPVFAGLELPEVALARREGRPMVEAELPVYAVTGKGGKPLNIARIGHRLKRNLDPLLKEFNEVTGLAQSIELDDAAKVAELQRKALKNPTEKDRFKLVRGIRLPQELSGYEVSPTGVDFLDRYSLAAGQTENPSLGVSGYLVRPTIFKSGGINTGVPAPETAGRIVVTDNDWNDRQLSTKHVGVGLFSEHPGVRGYLGSEKGRGLNPDRYSTISLLDEIAAQWGAEAGSSPALAAFRDFVDPVSIGAFARGPMERAFTPSASGVRSLTQLEDVRDVTQALAHRARYVQPPLLTVPAAPPRAPRSVPDGTLARLIAEARDAVSGTPEAQSGLAASAIRAELARRGVIARGGSLFTPGSVRPEALAVSAVDSAQPLPLPLLETMPEGYGRPLHAIITEALSGRSLGLAEPASGPVQVVRAGNLEDGFIPGVDTRFADELGYDLIPRASFPGNAPTLRARHLAPTIPAAPQGPRLAEETSRSKAAMSQLLQRMKLATGGSGNVEPMILFRQGDDGYVDIVGASARQRGTSAPAATRLTQGASGRVGPGEMTPSTADLLEELGIQERNPGWSDLLDTREATNPGFMVKGTPAAAREAMAPYVALAQDVGGVSREHAESVVEAAFRSASTPEAIAREIVRLVAPPVRQAAPRRAAAFVGPYAGQGMQGA